MANIEGHALSRCVCLWLFYVNLKLSEIFWIVYGGIPCHNLCCLAQSTCQLAKMRRNINRTWPRPFLWPRYALLALTVTWSGGVYPQEVWPMTHSLLHFVLSYPPPPSQRTYSNSDMWTLKWVISASVKLLGSELLWCAMLYLAEQGMIMKTITYKQNEDKTYSVTDSGTISTCEQDFR